jgi:hypothetical protein
MKTAAARHDAARKKDREEGIVVQSRRSTARFRDAALWLLGQKLQ